MSIFTDRLSSLLEKNNMTQRELAERIGVTTATLCRYVSGERQPKSDTVANIAMQSFKRNSASQSWFPKSWPENMLPVLKEIAVWQTGKQYMVFTKAYVLV